MTLAIVRPDSWNFPLLLHVLGAMVLTALLASLAVLLVVSLRRGGDQRAALVLAARIFTVGIVPSYLLMRIAAGGSPRRRTLPTTRPGSASATSPPTWGC